MDPQTLTETTIEPLNAIIAILVAVVGWILSRVTKRAVSGMLDRVQGISPPLRTLASRLAGYLVLFLGFGIALTILGFSVQPILAVALVVGVIAALALQGIAQNFAAGVVIQTQRPIEVGDEVEALGHNGVVRDLQGRAVVVETWDGKLVHLPNSEVLNNPLVNDTHSGARRSELEVRVASNDARSTRDGILRAVMSAPGVLKEPEPRVYLTAVDPERVTTLVHFWHAPSVSFSVTSDVLGALSEAGLGAMTAISPRPIAPFTPSPTV